MKAVSRNLLSRLGLYRQRIMYAFGWLLVKGFSLLMLRLEIKRQTRLPDGPVIFAANHPSATDPFLIHLISRQKQLNVLITEKAFMVPLFGLFLRSLHEIPVPLENGSQALEQAGKHLDCGRSVAIFVEGKISPVDGGFLPPRSGAARLALSSGVPVVPVGIYLRREKCFTIRSKISGGIPSEARWHLRGPYAITVGQPIHFSGDVQDREHVRRVSTAIMEKIEHLARESERRFLGWRGMLPAK